MFILKQDKILNIYHIAISNETNMQPCCYSHKIIIYCSQKGQIDLVNEINSAVPPQETRVGYCSLLNWYLEIEKRCPFLVPNSPL